MFWIFGFFCIVLLLGWWRNGYFRRNGVKNPTGCIPFVGNMLSLIRHKIHFKDFAHNLYKDYPDEKYVGFFQFHNPVLVVRDIELIKHITIKGFDHFQDRGTALNEDADPIFGRSLMSLRGQKWRDMRATLSPAFTSSKMRGMFQFIVDCGQQMVENYQKTKDTSFNKVRGIIEVEMKDAYTRYANDVIATCAFGLQINSFVEKENQFYSVGKDITDFTGVRFINILFIATFPKLAKMLNIHYLSKSTSNFFRSLVWDTIKDREERHIIRPDMIHLLNEARKGALKHDPTEDGEHSGFATAAESTLERTDNEKVWTDDEIVAQAVLFLLAGFDTTSTALCFATHELAHHPEIQKKLQNEIDQVAGSSNKLTYNSLQKMKYMDMVVSEVLRMWSPTPITDRRCNKKYTFPPPNKNSTKEFHMKPEDILWIPIHGLHHDPKYWNDPEVFDPERFSDENKHNIKPGSYMPFGIGPRNCIGSRFALVEMKAILFNLLLKFDFVTTAKTQNPIKLNLKTFSLHSEKGFWIGLKPRN